MALTLTGDGSITGLVAGGLPDLSIGTADIADAAITAAKLDGAQSGSAPIYAARAWVNFNGTGTVAIRASGNVSSITDNGTGQYAVNFTTAMPDADYVVVVTSGGTNTRITANSPLTSGGDPTTTSTSLGTYIDSTSSFTDPRYVNVTIFR